MIVALPAPTIRHLSSLSPSGTEISRCWACLPVFLQFSWPHPLQERIFSKRVGRILFFSTVFLDIVLKYTCILTIVNWAFYWFFLLLWTDIFFVSEFFYLTSVIKLDLVVVWVHAKINICCKKWKVYTLSIKLVNEKLQWRNWCSLIVQRIEYHPLWAGQIGRILTALGTNQIDQIAGFVEYHPLTNREKINNVISYTLLKDIPGLLLFIDYLKAFDTIEWTFLWKTPEHFGFGSFSINWINLFYYDIQAV